jgi:hypothetical protein
MGRVSILGTVRSLLSGVGVIAYMSVEYSTPLDLPHEQ